ncbi:MAG: ribosome recycling factor [Bacilli bacterium]|nr:ribosome recycling factor [Bacilli bacterium]MDD4406762.1 ribosome recycling factor [Bacilli bacterium]
MENIINDTEIKMKKVITNFGNRMENVRAGRANPAMLNGIMVNYYGALTPLNSLVNITIPEARQLFIKPFDKSALKDIDKALFEANLGITPTNNGEFIILTVPELNEERRKDFVKQVKQMAEEGKVGIRQVREDSRNLIKKAELPEDETDAYYDDIQDLTQKYNKIIEEMLKEKEKELMTV